LSLLAGSGLTTAVAIAAGDKAADMRPQQITLPFAKEVTDHARLTAKACGRGEPNIEDQVRAIVALLGGLRVMGHEETEHWEGALNQLLDNFLKAILRTEQGIQASMNKPMPEGETTEQPSLDAASSLVSFLLSFASRTASRERLNIFTTNYDRLIEFGSDLAGIRVIDRFVGALTPLFRSSRVDVDLHYNPPGIRGEPRYLEGVVRLTKLHGSIDWRWERPHLKRYGIPFGAPLDHDDAAKKPFDTMMIYPNPAKDVETLNYPYAELFRDFSAAVCRPNATLVTYGYGFGDDHINRVLKDMLTIPSTHLVIISFDDASGRIPHFCKDTGRVAQLSLLLGKHFGDLGMLVRHYLPKPAIDAISWRRSDLLKRRGEEQQPSSGQPSGGQPEGPEVGG
jgi:hypothetical protein